MPLLRAPQVYRGWWIVFTGYISQLATVGSTGWIFGVLIVPMQADLGWSRSEIVGVITLARLLSGVFSIKLGPLADRHGARGLMTVSAIAAAASMLGTAFVHSAWQYYLCWAVFGVCIPGLSTLGPAVAISNWFVRKRPQALMVYTLGSATAGLVLAPLTSGVTGAFGWREAWLFMAALFFSVAPMSWLLVRRRPEDYGLHPDGATEAESREIAAVANAAASAPTARWTVRQALHSRPFWLLSLAFMLTSFPAASIFVHMSSFVESKGFSHAEGALAISFYGAGVLAGRFVWGFVVTRVSVHRALVVYGIGYGVSILLFVFPTNLIAIYATTILLGISIAGAQQLNVQAFADYFGREIVGTLLGYAGSLAALTGAAAPLVAAAAYDRTQSYELTFSVFGVFCLIAGVAFIFSRPGSPADHSSQAEVILTP